MYIAYDLGKAKTNTDSAVIRVVDESGHAIGSIGPLPLGHAAEVGVRAANGWLYVATGGATNRTVVYAVDPKRARVVRTYMFRTTPVGMRPVGTNGMVAVDDRADRMIVFSGSPGDYLISTVEFDGTMVRQIRVPEAYQGVPQGIDVRDGDIWLYSSVPGGDRLLELRADGTPLRTIRIALRGEGEGLAVDQSSGEIWIGQNGPNRVGVVSPPLPR